MNAQWITPLNVKQVSNHLISYLSTFSSLPQEVSYLIDYLSDLVDGYHRATTTDMKSSAIRMADAIEYSDLMIDISRTIWGQLAEEQRRCIQQMVSGQSQSLLIPN